MPDWRRRWRAAAAGLLLLCGAVAAAAGDPEQPSAGSVVLLHGWARSPSAMRMFESGLAERGYAVCNVGYPSIDLPMEEIVVHVADAIESCETDPARPLHFVTHSMGGIVLRALLDGERRPANLGRVVMLAPPNRGTPVVDSLREAGILGVAGPSAARLGTDAESLPRSLPPVDFELGVLIGNESWNPVGSWIIPGEDDGMVAVDHARVEGMKDFRVVAASHTGILYSEAVLEEAAHFLAHGAFSEAASGAAE